MAFHRAMRLFRAETIRALPSAREARLRAARRPWDATLAELDAMFPKAGGTVDGRKVGGEGAVPNLGSIDASVENPTVAAGVREVPMSAFDPDPPTFYSKSERERTTRLAEEIGASGEIVPLIVVYDDEGPYVLEGGHRFDAMKLLGAKAFPALVVFDEGSLHSAVESALRAGEAVRPEVLAEYPDLAKRPARLAGSATKLPFFSNCVGWPKELLPALSLLIDKGEEIGRRRFLDRADADPEEVPRWDKHIQYFRYGKDVYWYVHSAIEHVFAWDESVGAVQRAAEAADY